MILTKKQEEAIKIILDRYKAGEKFSVLAGYAGTGKTTCIKFIVNALLNMDGVEEEDICFCSFTGKAVQVMIDKGNKNAITAHKLLYKAIPMPNGLFRYEPKMELEYKIIICDETSMLPMEMAKLLLSHNNIYVIFCGDNAQLPPIYADDDNHLLDNPHAFLPDVMRQAQDSGIIQLSMLIREGRRIDNFKTQDAVVLPRKDFVSGMLGWSDIVLCGTNATRIALNTQMRQMLGKEGIVDEDEKLIVLRNYWETFGSNGNALTNGVIGTLSKSFESEFRVPMFCHVENNKIPLIIGNFISETGEDFGNLEIDRKCIHTGETYLTPQQKYIIGKNKKLQHLLPYELTYGYCITTHKSQGSQWEKVLTIEEGFPFKKDEHKRWLYTACTRASDKVVIVSKE